MNKNYIIFTNLGLLEKSELNQVSQGNHNVDYYYIGYNTYDYTNGYLTVGVTLPNGVEMPELATSFKEFDYNGRTYKGFFFKLAGFLTNISGVMTMTFILKSLENDTELCTSQINIVIHSTDVPTEPRITEEQYSQLLEVIRENYIDLNDKIESGSGGGVVGGTTNYEKLYNKPKINGTELIGNKSSEDIGIYKISNLEISDLLK